MGLRSGRLSKEGNSEATEKKTDRSNYIKNLNFHFYSDGYQNPKMFKNRKRLINTKNKLVGKRGEGVKRYKLSVTKNINHRDIMQSIENTVNDIGIW